MPRFPKTEAKVAQLARQIADGLAHAAEEFPSPSVPPAELRAQVEDYREKSAALKPPGEVRNIAIRDQGDTFTLLTWEAPGDGGEVAVYRIQRSEPGGEWGDVATSVDRVELLRDQPRGVEPDFRVLAVNRAGVGGPSATVRAVL